MGFDLRQQPHRRVNSMRGSSDAEAARALLHHTTDDDTSSSNEKFNQQLNHENDDNETRWHKVSMESLEHDPLEPLSSNAHSPQRGVISSLLAHLTQDRRRTPTTAFSDYFQHHPTSSTSSLFGRVYQALIHLFLFLLPSFVRARYFPAAADRQPWKPHPTGFLDGLRGLAALFVFFFHTTNNLYDSVMFGYGAPGDERTGENNHILQLPIIKVLYAGPAAVSVFFIVSGFALSLKPIKQMRSTDDAGLMTTLNSSVFRRPLRLFLPCFISTFVVFIAVELGLFESTRFIAENNQILTGRWKIHIHQKDTFILQLQDWFNQAVAMPNIFGWSTDEFQGFYSDYDTHLWTIPIELRASLGLFLTHIALARFKPSMRISITAAACAWAIHEDRWEMLLFWMGMILCELYHGVCNPSQWFPSSSTPTPTLSTSSTSNPTNIAPPQRPLTLRIYKFFLFLTFISGMYLASYPNDRGDSTPGFRTLTALIPEHYHQKKRFWQGIGSLLIVHAVASWPVLSRAFSSRIPHYLGQISFALYLMHALVNHTVGYWMFYLMYRATNEWETPFKKRVGFSVVLVVDTIMVIWAADIFWRLGDRSSVKFTKWIEGVCLRKSTP